MNRLKRAQCLTLSVLAAAAPLAAAVQVPIDLSTWQKRGPAANGNWTVAPGGASVFQSINGDPTFFVSPTNQIDTTIRGSITVETTSDDDLVGFVLGFNGPASTGNDMDFRSTGSRRTSRRCAVAVGSSHGARCGRGQREGAAGPRFFPGRIG